MENNILFTAKRADNGEWITGSSLVIFPDKYTMMGLCEKPANGVGSITWREVISETICRFSGEKDIENNNINENHIIEFEYADECEPEHRGKCVGAVVFENGCFVVKEPGSNYECERPALLRDWLEDEECRIIGNLFDNQELWKR